MTASEKPAKARPSYTEVLADSGKAAVLVPLILGGAVIIGIIMLWQAHNRKARLLEMAEIEEQVRVELRSAYRDLRSLRPQQALATTGKSIQRLRDAKSSLPGDYAELEVGLYLLEGESLFMLDAKANAAAAEERFDQAMALMTHSSGEVWLFCMFGRARVRYEQGKYAEAIADLDTVLDRNPSFGAAYYWRSMSRERLGDEAGAAEDARRAWNLDSWPPLRDFMQAYGRWTRDILCPQEVRHPARGDRSFQ